MTKIKNFVTFVNFIFRHKRQYFHILSFVENIKSKILKIKDRGFPNRTRTVRISRSWTEGLRTNGPRNHDLGSPRRKSKRVKVSLAEDDLAAVTEDEKKKIEDEKRRIEASRGIKRKRNPSVDNKKVGGKIGANVGPPIKARNAPGVAITETSKARFQIDAPSSISDWPANQIV